MQCALQRSASREPPYLRSETVDLPQLLLDAALGVRSWGDCQTPLQEALEADAIELSLRVADDCGIQRVQKSLSSPLDQSALDAYHAHYSSIDCLSPGVVLGPPNEPIDVVETVGRTSMAKNAFFQEWCRPNGFVEILGVWSPLPSGRLIAFGPTRSSSRPFADHVHVALAELFPHVLRACLVAERLEELDIRIATLESTLDLLDCGVCLLQENSRVLHLNRRAKTLVDARDGLRMRDGRLTGTSTRNQTNLTSAIERARSSGFATGFAASQERICLTYDLFRVSNVPRWRNSPADLVLIVHSTMERRDMRGVLATIYGLTPAESRLASEIAKGHTIVQAAERFGVAASTARNQLKTIFSKLGVRRQPELVNVVNSLRVPSVGPEGVDIQPGRSVTLRRHPSHRRGTTARARGRGCRSAATGRRSERA